MTNNKSIEELKTNIYNFIVENSGIIMKDFYNNFQAESKSLINAALNLLLFLGKNIIILVSSTRVATPLRTTTTETPTLRLNEALISLKIPLFSNPNLTFDSASSLKNQKLLAFLFIFSNKACNLQFQFLLLKYRWYPN